MALAATTYATTIHRHIGSGAADTVIKSFYPTASVSYSIGDFVTIDSNGRVVLAATDGQAIDGIVASDVDNSSGDADDADKLVPVIVKGNVWVDAILSATGGDFDDALTIGLALGVAGDSGATAAEAQALAATPGGAGETQFYSASIQALPSAGNIIRKGLFFFSGSTTWG